MRVPFNMKYRPQIESGEYRIETREGVPAKIVCWDLKAYDDDMTLVVIIGENGSQDAITMSKRGYFYSDKMEHRYDLFIVTPEPKTELTEFEKAVRDCIKNNLINISEFGVFETFIDDHTAKEISAKLLDIARVELVDEQTKREDLSFSRGLRQGREEVKKSPWIPASNPPDDDRKIIIAMEVDNGNEIVTGYYRTGVFTTWIGLPIFPDYWMEIPELPKEE